MQYPAPMRSFRRGALPRPRSVAPTLALCLVVLAGCSGGGSAAPPVAPAPVFSNLALDRLGAAVTPGKTTRVEVTALTGALEPLTVVSSDPSVASVSTMDGAAATTITVMGLQPGSVTVTVTGDSGDSRRFPVTVYDPQVMDVGDMRIKFVDEFEFRWNDSGSNANSDGACWHPVAPQGFHALGSIGMPNYSDPNGRAWAIVVQDKGTNPENPPIVAPITYEPAFSLQRLIGTFPNLRFEEITFWRPVPPTMPNSDYVAMGIVAGRWAVIGQSVPPVGAEGAVCVRRDLTAPGQATQLWNDAGSGSRLPLMSLWRTGARTRTSGPAYPDYEQLYVGAAASVMLAGRADPSNVTAYQDLVRVLKIQPPVLVDAEHPGWHPTLTSTLDPSDDTQPVLTKSVLVPMTAFIDFAQPGAPNLRTLIQDSPFFVLQRRQYWNEEFWGSAGGRRSWTTGIENNQSQANWRENSVEVTGQFGFELKGISGSVTATVSETLGFASSTSVSTFEHSQTEVDVPPPPQGSRVALWRKRNEFLLMRHGEQGLEQALVPWVFDTNAFHMDTYVPGK